MSGTRLTGTKKELVDNAIAHTGGFAATLITDMALKHHAKDIANAIAEQTSNFIPCAAFAARLSTQMFNGLLAVRDGVDYNARALAKAIGTQIAIDVIAAEAATVAYNGINILVGRDASEIHPAENAAVKVLGTAAAAYATKKVGGMFGSLFCKPSAGSYGSLDAELLGNGNDEEAQISPASKNSM